MRNRGSTAKRCEDGPWESIRRSSSPPVCWGRRRAN